jgi:hypothetical protein
MCNSLLTAKEQGDFATVAGKNDKGNLLKKYSRQAGGISVAALVMTAYLFFCAGFRSAGYSRMDKLFVN